MANHHSVAASVPITVKNEDFITPMLRLVIIQFKQTPSNYDMSSVSIIIGASV